MPDVAPASHADVEAGRIILRAPLSALLLCRRIPNGSWDPQRKAWSFPATQEQARRVQGVIHLLSTTRQFDELLAPSAAPGPAAASVAPMPKPPAEAAGPEQGQGAIPAGVNCIGADCGGARVWLVRDGERWLMFVGGRRAGNRRKDFASPFMEHAIRTAEAWYGTPAGAWRREEKRDGQGNDDADRK